MQRRWEDLGAYSISLRNQLAAPPETESESEEEEREAELELPNTDSSEEDTDSGAESDATQDNANRPTTRHERFQHTSSYMNWTTYAVKRGCRCELGT